MTRLEDLKTNFSTVRSGRSAGISELDAAAKKDLVTLVALANAVGSKVKAGESVAKAKKTTQNLLQHKEYVLKQKIKAYAQNTAAGKAEQEVVARQLTELQAELQETVTLRKAFDGLDASVFSTEIVNQNLREDVKATDVTDLVHSWEERVETAKAATQEQIEEAAKLAEMDLAALKNDPEAVEGLRALLPAVQKAQSSLSDKDHEAKAKLGNIVKTGRKKLDGVRKNWFERHPATTVALGGTVGALAITGAAAALRNMNGDVADDMDADLGAAMVGTTSFDVNAEIAAEIDASNAASVEDLNAAGVTVDGLPTSAEIEAATAEMRSWAIPEEAPSSEFSFSDATPNAASLAEGLPTVDVSSFGVDLSTPVVEPVEALEEGTPSETVPTPETISTVTTPEATPAEQAMAERAAAYQRLAAMDSYPAPIEDIRVENGRLVVEVSDVDNMSVRNRAWGFVTRALGGDDAINSLAQRTQDYVGYDLVDNGGADECGDRDRIYAVALGQYDPNLVIEEGCSRGCSTVVEPVETLLGAPTSDYLNEQVLSDLQAEDPAEVAAALPSAVDVAGDLNISMCRPSAMEDMFMWVPDHSGQTTGTFMSERDYEAYVEANGGRAQVFVQYTNEAGQQVIMEANETKYGHFRGGANVMVSFATEEGLDVRGEGVGFEPVYVNHPMTLEEVRAEFERGNLDNFRSTEIQAQHNLAVSDRMIEDAFAEVSNGEITNTEDLNMAMFDAISERLNNGIANGEIMQGDAAFELARALEPSQYENYPGNVAEITIRAIAERGLMDEYLAQAETAADEIPGFAEYEETYAEYRRERAFFCDDPQTHAARIAAVSSLFFLGGGGGGAAAVIDAPAPIPIFGM